MPNGRRHFLGRDDILAALEVSDEDEGDDDLVMEIDQDDELAEEDEEEQVDEIFLDVPDDVEAILQVNIYTEYTGYPSGRISSKISFQCSVADPGCFIPDPSICSSRISDPGS
jgi:hypothetical protein